MARQLHALGLQFGLHRMRGIPRAAVKANLPIIGTRYRAQDIADISSTCSWNVDMYGVDMRKPGAQAYYDSVFAQYAHWGVDFVKVDDLSRPYDAHAPEIEAIALAIARSGRPMILSMSPGETPLVKANHVKRHAQMWRISDDFWDDWALLEAQFTRLENWSVHCGDGHWPDADMLPLGRIAMGSRDSRLTPDEQRTLMTLWSIARSPLIMGGDLRHLDAPTLALLTNPEVVAVNQHSHLNKPVFWQDGYRLWTARPKDGDGLYIALFNTASAARKIELPWAALGFAAPPHRLRDLWARTDLAAPGYSMSTEIPAHGAQLFLAR